MSVTDPSAGIFNLAVNKCQNIIKVYDGKRRYNIKVFRTESSVIKNSYFGEKNINTYKCAFEIKRIAGYTKKKLDKFPKKEKFGLKSIEKLSFYYPVKIQIETKWGTFLCLIKEGRK